MSHSTSHLHVCCVALGTRGDVQPVACIALHLKKTYADVSVSFITHAAHSSWLDSGIYASLTGKEYVASPPAGGCWAQDVGGSRQALHGDSSLQDNASRILSPIAPNVAATAATATPRVAAAAMTAGVATPGVAATAAAVAVIPTGSGPGTREPAARDVVTAAFEGTVPHAPLGRGSSTGSPAVEGSRNSSKEQPSLVQPDPRVIEAICNRIIAVLGAEGPAEPSAAAPSWHQKPLKQRLRSLRQIVGDQGGQKQAQEQQQQHQAQQQQQLQQQQRRRRRHFILFNFFALEAYHAAEALGLRSAVAAPYMVPYGCPAFFVEMFQRELPELYDTLRWAAQLQQQQRQQQQAEADAAAAASVMSVSVSPSLAAPLLEGSVRAEPCCVTFAEVTHWMWPLFTERWGEWRSAVLALPPLPLHRCRSTVTYGSEGQRLRCGAAGGGPDGNSYDDDDDGGGGALSDMEDLAVGDEPLPLNYLPPVPPLLYGFSELFVPRPAYWPPSVIMCGFWQPPLEWFVGQQLPADLVALLAALPAADTASAAVPATAETLPTTATVATAAMVDGLAANSTAGRTTGPELSFEVPSSRGPAAPAASAAPAVLPLPPPPPRATRTGGRWCLVDFGSSGRLGLIPHPLTTLTILDAVLRSLDMEAILLSGFWRPLHLAAAELRRRCCTPDRPGAGRGGGEHKAMGAAAAAADEGAAVAAATGEAEAEPPLGATGGVGAGVNRQIPMSSGFGHDSGGGGSPRRRSQAGSRSGLEVEPSTDALMGDPWVTGCPARARSPPRPAAQLPQRPPLLRPPPLQHQHQHQQQDEARRKRCRTPDVEFRLQTRAGRRSVNADPEAAAPAMDARDGGGKDPAQDDAAGGPKCGARIRAAMVAVAAEAARAAEAAGTGNEGCVVQGRRRVAEAPEPGSGCVGSSSDADYDDGVDTFMVSCTDDEEETGPARQRRRRRQPRRRAPHLRDEGEDRVPSGIVRMLVEAERGSADAAAVMVGTMTPTPAAAAAAVVVEAATPRLHLYGGEVAHQLVLPYCSLVLHHAGSGTTAAALQCAVPQVTCPLHFDQFFWADRLAHLGLSPPPLDRQLIFGPPAEAVAVSCDAAAVDAPHSSLNDPRVTALASAFRDALKPARQRAVRAMAEDLRAEGSGLQVAAINLLQAAFSS